MGTTSLELFSQYLLLSPPPHTHTKNDFKVDLPTGRTGKMVSDSHIYFLLPPKGTKEYNLGSCLVGAYSLTRDRLTLRVTALPLQPCLMHTHTGPREESFHPTLKGTGCLPRNYTASQDLNSEL